MARLRTVLAPSSRGAAAIAVLAALQHLGGHPETEFHMQTFAFAGVLLRAFSLDNYILANGGFLGAALPLAIFGWLSATRASLESAWPATPRRTIHGIGFLFVVALLFGLRTPCSSDCSRACRCSRSR